jgi:N-acetylneuraminic acid mutarotase
MQNFKRIFLTAVLISRLVYCQTARDESWKALAPIPIGTLQEHSTVAISPTLLAVIGGLVEGGATTAIVQLYDIPSNTWKRAAPLPIGLNHPNAAAVDGKIYLLSGLEAQGSRGIGTWRAVPNCWVYDPAADAWQVLESIPDAQKRGASAVAVYNRTVFLAGGIPGTSGRSVDTVSAFDTTAGKWLSLPDAATHIPAARDHVGGAVVGTKFYVLGGRDSGLTNTRDTVFNLDMTSLSSGWTISPAKMPTARGGLSAAAVGTKIFTFGGEGNRASQTGVFNHTEVYDTVKDEWTSLPSMRVPRHGTSAAEAGGRIYIPGGGIVQGVGATDAFDVFVP